MCYVTEHIQAVIQNTILLKRVRPPKTPNCARLLQEIVIVQSVTIRVASTGGDLIYVTAITRSTRTFR